MDDPLLGIRLSYTEFPELSGRGLSTCGHLSWGSCPFSALGRGSPRPEPVARPGSPVLPGCCQQVPPCQLRCRSQVFSTSQRLLPPSAVLPCFRQVALLGFALQGFSSHEAPDSSSLPACPLDVPPAGCASSVLVGGTSRRVIGCLGLAGITPIVVYRASVLVRIDPHRRTTFNDRQPTCPSWASASSWVAPLQLGKPSGLRPSRFTARWVCRQIRGRCDPRLARYRSGSSLARGTSHLEVLRLRLAPPFG